MILTCPECSTRYLTKDGAIGPNGRTVRCVKCETTWYVASEADELALQDNQAPVEDIVPATPGFSAATTSDASFEKEKIVSTTQASAVGAHVVMRDKVDKERRRRRLTSVGLIWAVPLFLLFVASILGYVFRQDIVNGVPQMATLYNAVGVDVSFQVLILKTQ